MCKINQFLITIIILLVGFRSGCSKTDTHCFQMKKYSWYNLFRQAFPSPFAGDGTGWEKPVKMALCLSRWCAWNKQSGFASCLFNGRRDYEIPSTSLLLARSVCQRHGLLKARKEPKDKEQYSHRRMCLNTLAYKKPNCFWRELSSSQHSIGMIVEMIHTASLVHDDVIDGSDTRRGKITVNKIWGERKAILAGDFVLSAASVALARLGNNTVVSIFTQAIEDLVRGEFMQLGSKENENERFGHYLEKTFKKTASLIANSCKAVSILGNCDPDVQEIAYQYGRNIGIAFQLVDDVLDFTSCANQLGKPAAADLKLGLATGPVLFACQQFPELHTLIMRRFSVDGDVDQAWQYVQQSDGVQQTCYLAHQYGQEAVRHISMLRPSPERDALIQLAEIVLTRNK
ncbi:decaprenyl-diphosphate synthase subunit 1 isoform X4 [Chiloscyllium plagiosum]|uniref:decaprenyl-diphosphate synthase subunit 1 isoform X4 n=1 Tax=Chiloscyllium plagiosum TaxID=36176 RepID=UPI001CB7DDB6|nr:decaprenyl-diphosphate synthase subunit 1 isoform X4 [Chiloscyllium plagiosum]